MLSSSKELLQMRVSSELDRLLADPNVTIAAGRAAALEVLRSHQQSGDPVLVWRDGRVVELDEQEMSRLIGELESEGTPSVPQVA